MSKVLDERDFAHLGDKTAAFAPTTSPPRRNSAAVTRRAPTSVAAEDMPFERCADGLIKHLVHGNLDTKECCVEAYMQFLKPGERSGKHRHMWEEVIFVVEGIGYDLHWDLKFDCVDAFEWDWAAEPKRFEWKRGDFIYVPPFTIHQHVAGDEDAASSSSPTASSRPWASTGSTSSKRRPGGRDRHGPAQAARSLCAVDRRQCRRLAGRAGRVSPPA